MNRDDVKAYAPIVKAEARRFLIEQPRVIATVDDVEQEAWLSLAESADSLDGARTRALVGKIVRRWLMHRYVTRVPDEERPGMFVSFEDVAATLEAASEDDGGDSAPIDPLAREALTVASCEDDVVDRVTISQLRDVMDGILKPDEHGEPTGDRFAQAHRRRTWIPCARKVLKITPVKRRSA